jgi:dTDP-L-rhamnose 4-epimerase
MLLEAVAERRNFLSALVVASSMSIYGEGRYACSECGTDDAEVIRTPEALRRRRWESTCRRCGAEACSLPTPETKPLRSDSVYAVTKRDQEDLCLVFGRAYGVRTVALRFFNVYGPRQSLSNPYTGVAAIFSSRLLNGRPPLVYEDGLQSRDFVHVSDIVRAIGLTLASESAADVALNVGTGTPTTVLEVAGLLGETLEIDLAPRIVNRFRQGDIRHCYADISETRRILGYAPRVSFIEGVRELAEWIAEEAPSADDRMALATRELTLRGLVV